MPEYASLIQLLLKTHGPMIEAAKADHLVRREGWLEIYRTPEELAKRVKERKTPVIILVFSLTFWTALH